MDLAFALEGLMMNGPERIDPRESSKNAVEAAPNHYSLGSCVRRPVPILADRSKTHKHFVYMWLAHRFWSG